jgi:hypothetical protein
MVGTVVRSITGFFSRSSGLTGIKNVTCELRVKIARKKADPLAKKETQVVPAG